MNTRVEHPRFVLITPARDEEGLIDQTIRSVVAQTVRPLRWIIVNDGSRDKTRRIVESFLDEHEFIRLLNLEHSEGRSFGSKAIAFKKGYEKLGSLAYDYIGNLDADISFETDYYARNFEAFAADPRVGITGGSVGELVDGKFVSQDRTLGSVGGAVQLFRRQCYEATGGYQPMTYGGIDAAVELKAKARGWQVAKLLQLPVLQGRGTGSVGMRPFASRLRDGRRFHSLGYGMFYYFLRCLLRSGERPWLIGGATAFLGYVESAVRGRPVLLDPESVRYWRREHRHRLWASLFGTRK